VSRHGAINHQRISVDSKTGTYKLEIRVKDKVKLAEVSFKHNNVFFFKKKIKILILFNQ